LCCLVHRQTNRHAYIHTDQKHNLHTVNLLRIQLTALVWLRGTAAGGEEGGAEEQATDDDNVNTSNANVTDESFKTSSPLQQPDDTHHDDTAAPAAADQAPDGQYSV